MLPNRAVLLNSVIDSHIRNGQQKYLDVGGQSRFEAHLLTQAYIQELSNTLKRHVERRTVPV